MTVSSSPRFLSVARSCLIAGVVAFAAFASSPLATAQSTMRSSTQVSLHVDGMTCGACPRTVKLALEQLAGVTEARVSLRQGRALVTYDAARVTPAQMVRAIANAGYTARVETGS
ncbi:MAG: heavy-metal-associated domain-containing protein [Deltaproteobacteria bacterium]|nr:heavy-metal-associated domain-containing protein [Deltaproteobacteria bacterium]